MNKVSKKFKQMAGMYKQFVPAGLRGGLDWSDAAMYDQFAFESGLPGRKVLHRENAVFAEKDADANGYTVGKRYMTMWLTQTLEDHYDGACPIALLYSDPELPEWFLDRVLPADMVECWHRIKTMPVGDARTLKSPEARRMARLPQTFTPLDYEPAA
jgi:hypothetical protein